MKKRKTDGELTRKLDKVFSEFIRRRDADDNGYSSCCTCGRSGHWKELQCGHFQTRGHYGLRWVENNCFTQCGRCNMLSGEQAKMARYIDLRYGEGTAKEIEDQRHKEGPDRAEKIRLIEHYTKLNKG